MLSGKRSILGYFFIAVLCLVVGFVVGQTHFVTAIQSAFQKTTQTTDSKPTSSGGATLAGNKSSRKKDPASIKRHYIKQNLEVFDLHAEYMASMLDSNLPGVTFKIRNNGDRSLQVVEVTVYFQDARENVIFEISYMPVVDSPFNFGNNNGPLQPGHVWEMGEGRFYGAKAVPSDWQEGAAFAKITHIEFVDSEKTTVTTGQSR